MGKVVRVYFVGKCHICRKHPREAMERGVLFFDSPSEKGTEVGDPIGWAHEDCLTEACADVLEHLRLNALMFEQALGAKRGVINRDIRALRKRFLSGRATHKSVLLFMQRLALKLVGAIRKEEKIALATMLLTGVQHLAKTNFLHQLPGVVRRAANDIG